MRRTMVVTTGLPGLILSITVKEYFSLYALCVYDYKDENANSRPTFLYVNSRL